MQLAIVQNPHVEKPETLWRIFDDDSISPEIPPDKFDQEGAEGLKMLMAKGAAFHIK